MGNPYFINVAKIRSRRRSHPVPDLPMADVISIKRPSTRKLSKAEEDRQRRLEQLREIRDDCMRRAYTMCGLIVELEKEGH